MAIPTSDMPGHRALHERAVGALDLCQETSDVEFKESSSWSTLRERIACTSMGMGNLRDGGLIVIGASERGGNWALSGINPVHLASYDVDNAISYVNSYASPHVALDIVRVEYRNGNEFLVVGIREFDDIPIVCKKNGPAGSKLVAGAVYVRPPGIAQTTRVTDAAQMRDLLDLAAEKLASRMIAQSHRIGMTPSVPNGTKFEEELGGL